jgi:hypothetical protein
MAVRSMSEPFLDAEARLEGFDNLMPFGCRTFCWSPASTTLSFCAKMGGSMSC